MDAVVGGLRKRYGNPEHVVIGGRVFGGAVAHKMKSMRIEEEVRRMKDAANSTQMVNDFFRVDLGEDDVVMFLEELFAASNEELFRVLCKAFALTAPIVHAMALLYQNFADLLEHILQTYAKHVLHTDEFASGRIVGQLSKFGEHMKGHAPSELADRVAGMSVISFCPFRPKTCLLSLLSFPLGDFADAIEQAKPSYTYAADVDAAYKNIRGFMSRLDLSVPEAQKNDAEEDSEQSTTSKVEQLQAQLLDVIDANFDALAEQESKYIAAARNIEEIAAEIAKLCATL